MSKSQDGSQPHLDETEENSIATIEQRLKSLSEAVEELSRAQEQPLAWFRRRWVGDVSERQAVVALKAGVTYLKLKIRDVVYELSQDRLRLQKVLEESQRVREESEKQWQAALHESQRVREESEKQWQAALHESQRMRKRAEEEFQSSTADNQHLQRQLDALHQRLGGLQKQMEKEQGLLVKSGNLIEELRGELQTALTNAKVLREKRNGLEKQLVVSQEQLAVESRSLADQLEAARQQIEELEERERQLMTGGLDEKIAFSYYEYHKRLRIVAREARVDGVLPRLEIVVNSEGIDTLFYSYNPSLVASALDKLNIFMKKVSTKKESLGRERVLDKDMFLHFAGVLGYYNLYKYLLYLQEVKQEDTHSRFLHLLCDLSVSFSRIQALVDDLDVVSWLAKHMPPKADVPNSPCSFTFFPPLKEGEGSRHRNYEKDVQEGSARLYYENYDDSMRKRIAKAIAELEIQRLLDFRESLNVCVLALAPLTLEEQERQEQSFPAEQPPPAEQATSPAQMPAFRVTSEVHQPDLDEGVHIIEYEYNDQRYLSTPVKYKLAFDNKGSVLIEESEQDE